MRRAALDRDVLISGLLSPGGTTGQILVQFCWSAFELITSAALIDELREVLGRDRIPVEIPREFLQSLV